MLLVYASRPVIDWILANSVQGAAAIGLLSFTLFGLVAIRNWRDGTKIASTLRHRMMQNPSADTGNTRGLHVIAGGLVFVWLAVLAFGLAEVNEEKRAIFILVAGGLTAFLGAPLALYPAALLFGAISRPGGFEATAVLAPAGPARDALARRANPDGMPPSAGFGPVAKVGNGHWRSDAVSLTVPAGPPELS